MSFLKQSFEKSLDDTMSYKNPFAIKIPHHQHKNHKQNNKDEDIIPDDFIEYVDPHVTDGNFFIFELDL